jgi:hypothetical protein
MPSANKQRVLFIIADETGRTFEIVKISMDQDASEPTYLTSCNKPSRAEGDGDLADSTFIVSTESGEVRCKMVKP